jgi:hypothetical protein
MTPTDQADSPRAAPNGDDPEILVRLVTKDVRVLRRFVAEHPVSVVRMLPPAEGRPPSATLIMHESVLVDARRVAEVEVTVLARPPTTERDTPQVGKGNRFEDPRVLPRGRGRILR